MLRLRAALAAALGALLAGCATPPSQPQPAGAQTVTPPSVTSAAVPPGAPVAVDGLYQGTSTRFRADRRDCPHPGLVSLYVQDRQFDFRWSREIDISGIIQPDGTLIGQNPEISLEGRLAAGTLEGNVSNGACGLHFTAVKSF